MTANPNGSVVQSLLVCPDPTLKEALRLAAATISSLSFVGEAEEYPSLSALRDQLIALAPEALFLDVGSNRTAALQLLAKIVEARPEISVVALSRSNDPDVILQCMRAGAAEFLASPFPPSDFQQAVQRIVRRRTAETGTKPARRGRLLAFAPAKGGSGCTTLACGVAAAVKRRTKSNVLLADLDLASGVIGFLLRLKTQYSVIDALRHSSQLDNTLWKSLVLEHNGVDVLAAPERPEQALTEAYPVQQALDFVRSLYDYIIVDLDGVTDSVSRVTLAAADHVHLVCCTEMTSLFMMRRTIPLLEDLGRSRDQINVLVNRAGGRPPLSQQDMEKIFRAPVHWTFPEDAAAVARAQREGDTVAEGSDLGKSLKQFVDGLAAEPERESVGGLGALKQLWGKT